MNRRTKPVDDETLLGGALRYPDWMEDWFYKQLTAEIRTEKGWENTRKRRNEAFDLAYYAIGIAYRPLEKESPFLHFGADRLKWNEIIWSLDWDRNDFVFTATVNGDAPIKQKTVSRGTTFADLGKKLG